MSKRVINKLKTKFLNLFSNKLNKFILVKALTKLTSKEVPAYLAKYCRSSDSDKPCLANKALPAPLA